VTQQGGKGATIYSVAEVAGVSIATVSRVLQGSSAVSATARQRVLDAVDVLNYVPLAAARNLAVRRHDAYGLVLPELIGPYYAELLLGFEFRAAELGQSVVLLLAKGKEQLAGDLRRLATRVDGLAILGSAAIPQDAVAALGGRRPIIMIAGGSHSDIEVIAAENVRSAAHLTSHLLDHGRRRLLFVGDPQLSPDVSDRHQGFLQALAAEPDAQVAEPVRIPFQEAEGQRFVDLLLAGEFQADGLVCANDELALSIMQRLESEGRRVPEDIAVVGWDDVMAARYIRPGLTTVRQPVRDLGELAATRLHERINGAEASPGRTLATQLVLRSSCGCTGPP